MQPPEPSRWILTAAARYDGMRRAELYSLLVITELTTWPYCDQPKQRQYLQTDHDSSPLILPYSQPSITDFVRHMKKGAVITLRGQVPID